MRLDKLLSNLKYGTRKEMTKEIKNGNVKVNGEIVTISHKSVNPVDDKILFNEKEVFYKETIILIMNKPSGYISTKDKGEGKTVYELISEPYNRFDLNIAGRLDKNTEGLLVLTNNGNVLHNIISPNKNVYKKYYVKTKNPFDTLDFNKKYHIKDGRDRLYVPDSPKVEYISENEFYLSIKEGKFHQIRRMVQNFNNEVVYLKRISIGNLKLPESLEIGELREINEIDI